MLRLDLSDTGRQIPNFDNLFIDFNALIYQCIRVNSKILSKVDAF
jgi:5'-3' exonuclease